MVPSVAAHLFLKGSIRVCSWDAGWRSVLLREFADPPCVDEFTTAATSDYFLSLVTKGSCHIESWRGGRWHAADYCVGSLGFRAPGMAGTLRWTSAERHQTLQLYLPVTFFDDALESLGRAPPLGPQLSMEDPLIGATMLNLKRALLEGAPDLYCETAAQFLAAHLLQRHGSARPVGTPRREDRRLHRVDAFLRENLEAPVTLSQIARVAGLSRFHVLRIFKSTYGETPLKRLTRLRIAEARRLLARNTESVTEVGLRCGYGNPSHFAAEFRRHVGVSPSAYRASGATATPGH
jgi:AraC family transcriptional regulator